MGIHLSTLDGYLCLFSRQIYCIVSVIIQWTLYNIEAQHLIHLVNAFIKFVQLLHITHMTVLAELSFQLDLGICKSKCVATKYHASTAQQATKTREWLIWHFNAITTIYLNGSQFRTCQYVSQEAFRSVKTRQSNTIRLPVMCRTWKVI